MRTVTLCAQHGWASRAGTHDHCVDRFAVEGDDSECALVLVALLRVTPGAEPTVEQKWWCAPHGDVSQTPFPSFCYRKQTWNLIAEDTADDPCLFVRVVLLRGVEPE